MVAEQRATAAEETMAGAAGVDPDLLPAAGAPTVLQPPGLQEQAASGKGKGNGGWKRRMVGEGRPQEVAEEASGSGGGGGMTMEMRRELDRMWQEWTSQHQHQQGAAEAEPPRKEKEDFKRVILDEKYFRRVDKFDGDVTKFRGWMFDLMVAIGQVDNELAKEVKGILARGLDEKWNPETDADIQVWTYEKYTAELYGIICSLTTGEAKNVVRGIMDTSLAQDGYKALVILNKRFDAKTSASLLQSFLDVVKPQAMKGTQDIVSGIHKWETRVTGLKSRYGEDLNDNLKLAILIGMLPKDYQDLVMQTSCMTNKMSYSGIRDNVLNIANQRIQMTQPVPMDLGAVEEAGVDWGGFEDQQEVDAVGANTQCYSCGGYGHLARTCTKGKGDQKGKGGFGKGGGKDYGKGYGKSWSPYGKGGAYNPKGYGKDGGGKGGKDGGGKGYGKDGGGKGGGYGYQGVCWKCNRIGHKAMECRVGINEVDGGRSDTTKEECAVEIGGCWNVCAVEVSADGDRNPAGRSEFYADSSKMRKFKEPKTPTRNSFGILQDEEEATEDVAGAPRCGWCSKMLLVLQEESFPKLGCCEEGKCKVKFKKINKKDWRKLPRMKAIEEEDEDVWIQPVETDKTMKLGFQVADVKKPLISVKRICEKDNLVSFGPKLEDNFILNRTSGDKLMLKPSGKGCYVMDVSFVNGERTTITVDSGAEENVCPWEWGQQFGIQPADNWMNFRNASGGWMEHYGKRDVVVTSPF
jgi:hypothetical protein